jgi:hypothetical protein
MQVGGLVEIILYVLPGFVANEVYKAFYPVRDRGHFPQLAWSVAVGVLLTTALVEADSVWLSGALGSTTDSIPELAFIAALFSFGILVGLGRALLRFVRYKVANTWPLMKWLAPDPQSIWVHVNQPSNQDWAVVFLRDGSVYLGYIKYYRFDPEESDQDFLLSYARRVNENLEQVYAVPGQGVYLNTRDVTRIEFVPGSQGDTSEAPKYEPHA